MDGNKLNVEASLWVLNINVEVYVIKEGLPWGSIPFISFRFQTFYTLKQPYCI